MIQVDRTLHSDCLVVRRHRDEQRRGSAFRRWIGVRAGGIDGGGEIGPSIGGTIYRRENHRAAGGVTNDADSVGEHAEFARALPQQAHRLLAVLACHLTHILARLRTGGGWPPSGRGGRWRIRVAHTGGR